MERNTTMTVTNVDVNTEAKTLTLTAHFEATTDKVWQLWANPRLLERWWGPPTYPATMVDHDLTAGGRVTYFMTSPEGDKHHGWWQILHVDAPRVIEFDDGFGDAEGKPNPEMPVTRARVVIEAVADGGTQMTLSSEFPTAEVMAQLVEMGMQEGITLAAGQMDALL
jgi:uncharacterized protein YndB with AHSA1/START domain